MYTCSGNKFSQIKEMFSKFLQIDNRRELLYENQIYFIFFNINKYYQKEESTSFVCYVLHATLTMIKEK